MPRPRYSSARYNSTTTPAPPPPPFFFEVGSPTSRGRKLSGPQRRWLKRCPGRSESGYDSGVLGSKNRRLPLVMSVRCTRRGPSAKGPMSRLLSLRSRSPGLGRPHGHLPNPQAVGFPSGRVKSLCWEVVHSSQQW